MAASPHRRCGLFRLPSICVLRVPIRSVRPPCLWSTPCSCVPLGAPATLTTIRPLCPDAVFLSATSEGRVWWQGCGPTSVRLACRTQGPEVPTRCSCHGRPGVIFNRRSNTHRDHIATHSCHRTPPGCCWVDRRPRQSSDGCHQSFGLTPAHVDVAADCTPSVAGRRNGDVFHLHGPDSHQPGARTQGNLAACRTFIAALSWLPFPASFCHRLLG